MQVAYRHTSKDYRFPESELLGDSCAAPAVNCRLKKHHQREKHSVKHSNRAFGEKGHEDNCRS
jgi:hypothetical protein